jgi:hypothetical protein
MFSNTDKQGPRVACKRVEILRQHCALGPVPASKNPDCSVVFTDTIGDPNHAMRGSTTYLPNAEGRAAAVSAIASVNDDAAAAAAAPRVLLSPAPADNKIEVVMLPSMDDAANATARRKKKKRKKKATAPMAVTNDASTAMPLSSTAPVAKKSKPTSKKKAAKPINLCKTPQWVQTTDPAKHRVVAIAHEQKWVASNTETITGNVADEPYLSGCPWSHNGPSGETIAPGDRDFEDMSPLEAFLHMMPPAQLSLVLNLTNKRLATKKKKELTKQELLQWIGVCVLISSTNFRGDRRKLWEGGGAISRFLPSYNLRDTGMSRNRFDNIWYNARWSWQPPKQPEGMSLERYHWMLVDDFVANFNRHRQTTFKPGGHLEADETVIRWYGVGGAFVNAGLPMYLALERKPDNGGEIQNLADVSSGIMLGLKVVKSATEEKAIIAEDVAASADDNDDCIAGNLGKGTQVLLELTELWHYSGRLVTADAYFASVEAALETANKGLYFIGNVKQCSKRFLMKVLAKKTRLLRRGSRLVLTSISGKTGETELVAISWVDPNRRFFVMTTYGSGKGKTITHKCLRQLFKSGRAQPDTVIINVGVPKTIKMC